MKELGRIAAAATIGGALAFSSPAETGDAPPGPGVTEPIPSIACEVTIEKPIDGELTEIELEELLGEAFEAVLSGECVPMAPELVPEPSPQIPVLVAVLPAKQDLFTR